MHLKQISSYKLRHVYLDSIWYLYKLYILCSKQRVQCVLLRGTCPAQFLLSKSVQVEWFLLVLPVLVAVVVLGERGVGKLVFYAQSTGTQRGVTVEDNTV